MTQERFRRVFVFLFILFVTSILFILTLTPAAHGYEIDIYSIYPWFFWALIICSLFMGAAVMIFSKSRINITYGFIIMVITNLILLSLQFVRGYFFFGGGDIFTHVGFVRDLKVYGHVASTNFYPNQHILTLVLHEINFISIEMSIRLLSPIFYILFISTLFIFLRKYPTKKFKYCMVIGALLLFTSEHLSPIPNILSFLYIPLILFLLSKIDVSTSKIKFNILLFMIVLSAIFFHPITSLYIIGVLILFKITSHITVRFWNSNQNLPYLNITTISSIGAWLGWHLGFSSIRRGIRTTIYSIIYEPGLNPRAEDYTETLGMFDIHILDIGRKFIFDYGILSILFLLSLFYLIYMSFINKTITKFVKQRKTLFLITSVFIFTTWATINFFADFVSFTRVFKLIILFSFLLVGFVVSYNIDYRLLFNIRHKNMHLTILSFLVVVLILISVFGVYPSPISFSSNRQVSEQENHGMRWFFESHNDERLTWEEGIRQRRWADFIYGLEGEDRPDNIRRDPNVKNHYGYLEHERMAVNYTGYFIKTDIHMLTYRYIFSDYEQYWRFNESSDERFERDRSVNKIYDNGFFTSYTIEGIEDQ